MAKDIPNIDAVLPKNILDGQARPLDDYLDQDLIIYSCREVKGINGDYMRFVVSDTPEGEQFYLATGATQPFEALQYLDDEHLFPVMAKFVRKGRAILLVAAG